MCNPPAPAPTPSSGNTRSSKSSKSLPPEQRLVLPLHDHLADIPEGTQGSVELVDTHTHVLSTFRAYREKYPDGAYSTVADFIRAHLQGEGSNRVQAVVDVWCEAEAPSERPEWKETVDSLSALEGLDYRFVVGAHPHDAKHYTPALEAAFLEAHAHPRCVGWGEMGLDYHYSNSPHDVQQDVLRRQLRAAIGSGLNKAITIHTREADDDILRILTEELPRDSRCHIHCMTDGLPLADALLSRFPNLYIGVTGVITFASNLNTTAIVRSLGRSCSPSNPSGLRILLETDAPFMIPSNLGPNSKLGMTSKQKMPFSHSGMLPWTAEWVAKVLNEAAREERRDEEEGWRDWTTVDVLKVARENARKVYGV
ncbi:hypothetical protein JCM21900_003275 [Sporobolomyces salmonicolor]